MTRPAKPAVAVVPVRTFLVGSGTFALPVFEAILAQPALVVVGVLAPPDRPTGRHHAIKPVPVAALARQRGLNLLQPDRLRVPETVAAIRDLNADFGILADFGRIVPESILELFDEGILNVHPSLLPRHRGATPIAATIMAGDTVAGVSIMRMNAGLDTGPLVGSRWWPLLGSETTPELEGRAARQGAELITEVIEPYLRGEITPLEQDETSATLTRPLRRSDGRLDPGRPAELLERQVRAFLPWPGSYLESPSGRVTVLRASIAPAETRDRPGELVADGNGLALATAEGRLRLIEVKGEGGRAMPSAAFRRGHPAFVGQLVLGTR